MVLRSNGQFDIRLFAGLLVDLLERSNRSFNLVLCDVLRASPFVCVEDAIKPGFRMIAMFVASVTQVIEVLLNQLLKRRFLDPPSRRGGDDLHPLPTSQVFARHRF